jgi:hypothetical protein
LGFRWSRKANELADIAAAAASQERLLEEEHMAAAADAACMMEELQLLQAKHAALETAVNAAL